MKDLNPMVKHYLITLLWSTNDNEGNPLDDKSSIEDISEEGIEMAIKDCEDFKSKVKDEILDRYDDSSLGHDFFLTRNGHGSGFWDGDYGKEDGDILTEISNSFNKIDAYRGDDGKIYFS